MSLRRAPAALALVFGSAALVACESAANLDLVYADAAGASDAGTADVTPGDELEGCPCDESQGLGCCLVMNGVPYCTLDQTACASEKGLLLKCFHGDPRSESVCCWNASGTRLAAGCDGGAPACVTAADCPSGTGCATSVCNGIVIGACSATKPACPP
jgi:hypothetical protein